MQSSGRLAGLAVPQMLTVSACDSQVGIERQKRNDSIASAVIVATMPLSTTEQDI